MLSIARLSQPNCPSPAPPAPALEELPPPAPVLVLSYEFWQSRLGGDPSIVGQTVEMTDRMHTVVAAARANGLRCMDGPYSAFKDATGLERAGKIARAMGFDGKQCIHPAQLPVVNAVFGPSDEEVARAEAVVRAYEDTVASGRGVATHDGRMIDAASLRMARSILSHRRQPA